MISGKPTNLAGKLRDQKLPHPSLRTASELIMKVIDDDDEFFPPRNIELTNIFRTTMYKKIDMTNLLPSS